MSDSVRPHRRQPIRLPHPWDSPGKSTGVGCHFLLQCVKVKSLSRVRLLAIPWTAAHQAPLSMGFSRQEYWSWVPLPSPGWLKQQKFLFSQFQVLEVQDQVSSGLVSSKTTLLGLEIPPASSHGFPSVHFCVCNLLSLQGHKSYWTGAHSNDLTLN